MTFFEANARLHREALQKKVQLKRTDSFAAWTRTEKPTSAFTTSITLVFFFLPPPAILSKIRTASILYPLLYLFSDVRPPTTPAATPKVSTGQQMSTHTEGEVTPNQYWFAGEVTRTLFHVDSFFSFCGRLFAGSMFCDLKIRLIYDLFSFQRLKILLLTFSFVI